MFFGKFYSTAIFFLKEKLFSEPRVVDVQMEGEVMNFLGGHFFAANFYFVFFGEEDFLERKCDLRNLGSWT